jgi:hypothetical protein
LHGRGAGPLAARVCRGWTRLNQEIPIARLRQSPETKGVGRALRPICRLGWRQRALRSTQRRPLALWRRPTAGRMTSKASSGPQTQPGQIGVIYHRRLAALISSAQACLCARKHKLVRGSAPSAAGFQRTITSLRRT